VSAQIYQYTGPDGVVRFTNDISAVPKDQLPHMEVHDELQSSPDTESSPTGPVSLPTKITHDASDKKGQTKPEATDIEQKKIELGKEFNTLMKEKMRIEKETAYWSKRYKTRKRKRIARGKLKELHAQKQEWEKQYRLYEKKKAAIDKELNESRQ
jgi:hypothetical protein